MKSWFDKIRMDLIIALAGDMPVVLNMQIAPGLPGCAVVSYPQPTKPGIFCYNEIFIEPREYTLYPVREKDCQAPHDKALVVPFTPGAC